MEEVIEDAKNLALKLKDSNSIYAHNEFQQQ